MSRKTRANRTARRALERQSQAIEPKRSFLRATALKVIAASVGIPGVLAALLALLPRISVALSDPVDPENPFSSSVTLTNTGYIPLDAVVPFFAVGQIGTPPGAHQNLGFCPDYKSPRIVREQWGFPRDMAIDDRFGFPLNDVWDTFQHGLEFADIAIVVQYKIPLLRLQREKIYPFIAQKQTNGRFYWYPKLPCKKSN